MATAADSVATRAASKSSLRPRLSIPQAWHLLSLDAPTVAALWSIFLARAMGIDLPWHSPLILALGTWLIYAADRLLDAHRPSPNTVLQERHRFHARHRLAFLSAGAAISGILCWLIVSKMPAAARRQDSVLFLLSVLYLSLVHRPANTTRSWLPKELAVGTVFAAATAVPAWSRLQSGRSALIPAVALFAALCWLNCAAIERWESLPREAADASGIANALIRPAASHLPGAALVLAALSGAAGLIAAARSSPTALLYLAILASSTALAVIDRNRGRCSVLGLRIGADAALLTPLLLLPFLTPTLG